MSFHPAQAADNCFRRARRLLSLSEDDLPEHSRARNDLRRLAVVMAVAGLDSYLHAMVLKTSRVLRRSGRLPRSWIRLDVPIEELANLASRVVGARRAATDCRPWVQVGNALQRRILRQPFQSSEQVAQAAALCGKKRVWELTAKALRSTPEKTRITLDRIVMRRNQIVHEGDITRRIKPQKLKLNKMSAATCRRQIDWLSELVNALETVLN